MEKGEPSGYSNLEDNEICESWGKLHAAGTLHENTHRIPVLLFLCSKA